MNYRTCEHVHELDILPTLAECVKVQVACIITGEIMDHGNKSTYMSARFVVKKASLTFIKNPKGSPSLMSS